MIDLASLEARLTEERHRLTTLSNRERSVYELWLTGIKQYDIGFRLELSPKTVNTYKTLIQGKLRCNSDVELVKFAIRHSLVDAWAPQEKLEHRQVFLRINAEAAPFKQHLTLKSVDIPA
jgi:DNA-binding CsgD family transcriptional regulator